MAVLAAVAGLTALITVFVMARSRSASGAFVIGASWLRFTMSAFHQITYRPMVAGQSLNALGSIGLFALGLTMINWRHLALRFLLPFYAFIGIVLVSAIANAEIGPGLIIVLTKFGYLIVMTLAVYAAMRRNPMFMNSLLWAFAPLLIYQLASLALGISKATETDASAVSFIGGYYHESAFSVSLATCLVVACFADRLNVFIRYGLIFACVAGIVLANYRTTLVAIAPLLLMFFAATSLRPFPWRDRPFVVSALVVVVAMLAGVISLIFAERFEDVGVVTSGSIDFFKPSEEYTVEESRVLSGRPRIWSMYIYAWIRGDMLNHVLGFGPESWAEIFPLYAHNTLVNTLYEYGPVGVIGMLVLWGSCLAAALRVRHPQRGVLLGAHLSFLMLNMSTMPMWMVEGNILYGIICGYTLYLLSQQQQQQRAQNQRVMRHPAPMSQAGSR